MGDVAPSEWRVGYGQAAGKVYGSVSSGLCDGLVPTTEIKKDNKEAENSESRLSCALHLAGHKSAQTGLYLPSGPRSCQLTTVQDRYQKVVVTF